MIYLSRLIINLDSRAVRRDLADCQALHRTIMRAFPTVTEGSEGARERFGVLFRLEEGRRTGAPPSLLVQSRIEPDWAGLPEGYLLETADAPVNPACKRVDERYGALAPGAVLRFRLRANPTRKVETKSGPDGARRNGRRIGLRNEAERIAWLQRKGETGGFRLRAVRGQPLVANAQTGLETVTGSRARAGGSTAHLTFEAVLFEGILEVTDPDCFLKTLAEGIGPAKAYGFGLLSIARASE